jgi:mannose-6-phosphate isomerase-like protein (cupin superfamily)
VPGIKACHAFLWLFAPSSVNSGKNPVIILSLPKIMADLKRVVKKTVAKTIYLVISYVLKSPSYEDLAMSNLLEYIESGILEMYVMGITSPEESIEVEAMAKKHPEIRSEIATISKNLELYSELHALQPAPTIKPFLMASIDYMERMKKGEKPSYPPQLNEYSKIQDYKEWLERPDIILPSDFSHFYAKIIGNTPEMITAVIWIGKMAPPEVHKDEYEKFLILEGTCDITISDKVHHLKAGDYLAIPLHETHMVQVTSDVPCKAILQRIAA